MLKSGLRWKKSVKKQLNDPSMIAARKNLQANWIKQSAVDRNLRHTIVRKEIPRRAPEGALCWAVDKNGVTIYFHYPEGLQAEYGRFYVDIDTYLSVEPPRLPDGVCHRKHDKLLESNAFDSARGAV